MEGMVCLLSGEDAAGDGERDVGLATVLDVLVLFGGFDVGNASPLDGAAERGLSGRRHTGVLQVVRELADHVQRGLGDGLLHLGATARVGGDAPRDGEVEPAVPERTHAGLALPLGDRDVEDLGVVVGLVRPARAVEHDHGVGPQRRADGDEGGLGGLGRAGGAHAKPGILRLRLPRHSSTAREGTAKPEDRMVRSSFWLRPRFCWPTWYRWEATTRAASTMFGSMLEAPVV